MLARRIALAVFVAFVAACPAASAETQHLGDRGLRLGAHGHDVRVLQDLLGRTGYPTAVDGRFGGGTRSAVRSFQRAAGLRASGAVGPATVAALRAGISRPPSAVDSASTESATIDASGLALAPSSAPAPVAAAVAAGNEIAKLPYRWGGGHRTFQDTGYDCSGSVSYALHGAGLLDAPLDSTGLESWGSPGPGRWITVYANAGHVFVLMAGVRFDTSGQARAGTRWQPAPRSVAGYTVRHPAGL